MSVPNGWCEWEVRPYPRGGPSHVVVGDTTADATDPELLAAMTRAALEDSRPNGGSDPDGQQLAGPGEAKGGRSGPHGRSPTAPASPRETT